jgi:hypothetical protein
VIGQEAGVKDWLAWHAAYDDLSSSLDPAPAAA